MASICALAHYEAECQEQTIALAAMAQTPVGEFAACFIAWLATTAADYLQGLDYCRSRLLRGQALPWIAE